MNRKRDVRALVVVLVVLVVGLIYGSRQPADAMVPEDLLTMVEVSLLDVSSAGDFLLFGLRAWDDAAREQVTTIYRRDLVTGKNQQVATVGIRLTWGDVELVDGELGAEHGG